MQHPSIFETQQTTNNEVCCYLCCNIKYLNIIPLVYWKQHNTGIYWEPNTIFQTAVSLNIMNWFAALEAKNIIWICINQIDLLDQYLTKWNKVHGDWIICWSMHRAWYLELWFVINQHHWWCRILEQHIYVKCWSCIIRIQKHKRNYQKESGHTHQLQQRY